LPRSVAFTDDPNARSDTWAIRQLPPLIPTDLPRSSRFPKMCAHRVLPDYDVSLYIDTRVLLKTPPERILSELFDGHNAPMTCFRHDLRTTIEEEAEAIIGAGYDQADICRAQLAAYLEDSYGGAAPLIWGGVLMRSHNEERIRDAMERWFAQILRYSRRDQLSFPYVAEKTELSFVAHALSNRETEWHQWPVPWDGDLSPSVEALARGPSQKARDLAESERELAQARAALFAMQTSTSWRMTAPLRKIARMVRR
jgi:hypothetical protein